MQSLYHWFVNKYFHRAQLFLINGLKMNERNHPSQPFDEKVSNKEDCAINIDGLENRKNENDLVVVDLEGEQQEEEEGESNSSNTDDVDFLINEKLEEGKI